MRRATSVYFSSAVPALLFWIASAMATMGLPSSAAASESATAQPPRQFSAQFVPAKVEFEHFSLPYQIFLPPGYTGAKKWPVVLYFHGVGEVGTDNQKQLTSGLGPWLSKNPERFQAIVVLPQTPKRWESLVLQGRADSPRIWDLAWIAVENVLRNYNGDPKRVSLTGNSMGGYGAWSFATLHPERFSAVLPICGWSDNPEVTAQQLRNTPVWVFHGLLDLVIPVAESRKIVDALHKVGSRLVRYTEVPFAGHNSWDTAYSDEQVVKWMLQSGSSTQRSGR